MRDEKGGWVWKSRTSLAGEYPQQLTKRWAELLATVAPPGAQLCTSDSNSIEPAFLEQWGQELVACVSRSNKPAKLQTPTVTGLFYRTGN